MTPARTSHAVNNEQDFDRMLIAAIIEASPDGILVVDDRNMIVSHNQRLFDVLGISPGQIPGGHGGVLAGLSDDTLLSRVIELVKDREDFQQRVRELYADPLLEDHREVELKDERTLERHSRSLWSADRQYLGRVWFFRDITERKQTEATLQELSQRDPLTGVGNRRFFFERADEAFFRARRFNRELSFIMLDIDRFKSVNDRWGHAAGDRVLKNLCAVIDSVLRKVDLLGRVGGEEFAVLVPDTGLDGAFLLAERVRKKIEMQGVPEDAGMITYTVSAGVAAVAPEDTSPEDTLNRADAAMYEAKRAGRNCTVRAA